MKKTYETAQWFGGHGGSLNDGWFQSDFLLKDHFSTTDSWLPGRRILMERDVAFPESAKGRKIKVKLGIWNPLDKTVLSFGSDQQKYVIGELEL